MRVYTAIKLSCAYTYTNVCVVLLRNEGHIILHVICTRDAHKELYAYICSYVRACLTFKLLGVHMLSCVIRAYVTHPHASCT